MSREAELRKKRRISAREWAEKEGKTENTLYNLPEGVELFGFAKAGKYYIDVIPYTIGKRNPQGEAGMISFGRKIGVHNNLGGDGKKRYLCRNVTWGLPCPICKFNNTLNREEQKKLKLWPQSRLLLNLIDVESKSGSIQILDQAFGTAKRPFFGQLLVNKLDAMEEYTYFYELKKEDGAYTLQLTVVPDSIEGTTFMKVTNIEMIPRKKDLPESILDEAVQFDDILIDMGEEGLQQILDSGHINTDDDEPQTRGRNEDQETRVPSRTRRSEPDEDEDEVPAKSKKKVDEDDEDGDDGWKKPSRPSAPAVEEDDEEDDRPKSRRPIR